MNASMFCRNRFFLVFFFGGIFFSGCYYDNHETLYPASFFPVCDDTTGITYEKDILPIMTTHCATYGCHASVAPSGYDLSHFEGVSASGRNGTLLATIRHESIYPMPQGMPKLDDCTIQKISSWIRSGMPEK